MTSTNQQQVEQPLHVYFSAPSISNDEQKELFTSIRNTLNELGHHITYDWLRDTVKDEPKQLFEKAFQGINEADVVIAEVTFPSTGVGQQIALATSKKIPVVALYAKGKEPASRFTAGSENELLKVIEYQKDNLKDILKDILDDIGKERFEKFNFISTREINETLEEESQNLNISRSRLLRQIVREWFSRKLQ